MCETKTCAAIYRARDARVNSESAHSNVYGQFSCSRVVWFPTKCHHAFPARSVSTGSFGGRARWWLERESNLIGSLSFKRQTKISVLAGQLPKQCWSYGETLGKHGCQTYRLLIFWEIQFQNDIIWQINCKIGDGHQILRSLHQINILIAQKITVAVIHSFPHAQFSEFLLQFESNYSTRNQSMSQNRSCYRLYLYANSIESRSNGSTPCTMYHHGSL